MASELLLEIIVITLGIIFIIILLGKVIDAICSDNILDQDYPKEQQDQIKKDF